jgi:hypothetical protein
VGDVLCAEDEVAGNVEGFGDAAGGGPDVWVGKVRESFALDFGR